MVGQLNRLFVDYNWLLFFSFFQKVKGSEPETVEGNKQMKKDSTAVSQVITYFNAPVNLEDWGVY